jgi:hypothetical protein
MLLLIPFGDLRSIPRLRSCGATAIAGDAYLVMMDDRN